MSNKKLILFVALLAVFSQISLAQDKSASVSYEKGMQKLEAKDYRCALDDLLPITRNNPAELKAFLAASAAYQGLGDASRATSILKTAIKFHPKETNLHLRIAEIYRKIGDFDNAINWYEKLLSLESDNLYVTMQLALTCFDKEDLEKSAFYFRMAIKLDESKPQPHFWLGTIYILQEKIEEAIASHERFLELDKDDSMGATEMIEKKLKKLRAAVKK